jgi:hypothetical protein
VARVDCEAYQVSAEGVREILNRFPDLGDVILRAIAFVHEYLKTA